MSILISARAMEADFTVPTTNRGSHHSHRHQHAQSHSFSDSTCFLSPSTAGANGHGGVKKAVSANDLYTHAETSRETSPVPSRSFYKQSLNTPYEQHSWSSHHNNSHSPNGHAKSPSAFVFPMKSGRARGESDLGRPANPHSAVYRPTLGRLDSDTPADVTRWISLPEAMTGLLIPLPYMLASAAYSSISGEELGGGTQLSHGNDWDGLKLSIRKFSSDSGLMEACTLTSGTLLLVGILAKIIPTQKVLDRRKDSSAKMLLTASTARSMAVNVVSIGLPFYSAMQIGGLRTGLVILVAIGGCLKPPGTSLSCSVPEWKHVLSSRAATLTVITVSMILDFMGWTFHAPFSDMILGYAALMLSVLVVPLPMSAQDSPVSHASTSKSVFAGSGAISRLVATPADINVTLLAGLFLSMMSIAMSMIWSIAPSIGASAMIFSTLSVAAMSATILFGNPAALHSEFQAGLGLGCVFTACCAFLYSPSLWPGTICNGGLTALSFLGVLYDCNTVLEDNIPQNVQLMATHVHHSHDHHLHDHGLTSTSPNAHSKFTALILNRCEPGSLLHQILNERDSRRILYFTTLNFGFMFVQGVYGYLSGSLGLLSDTVHMFFDCLGLVVGLGAAVASKLPPTAEKPYGWGKLNTLAGFGNGVFLMLVSVEFVWEAIEGIVEHKHLRHVQELLVVSVAGLLVNLVGLFAFGHSHAGHDHGHSHGHSHSQSHHGQAHHTANSLTPSSGCSHDHTYNNATSAHPHANPHNENMHGIYLHVAADAGGSLAVIISTALTLWKPWHLWDPLATIIIAVLIFAAAVPLVTSSGQKLLLVLPEDLEYGVKNTLQELGELRGVAGYAAPRFWVDEAGSAVDGHGGHEHHHSHAEHNPHQKVMGAIHVIAAHAADLDDVRERVDEFMRERGMAVVIQVERESDGPCWCGGLSLPRAG